MQRVIAIDWSGRKDKPGQRRHIWAGVWTSRKDEVSVTLENNHTHESILPWLAHKAEETPRMVVGIDFCFSYPAWFLRELKIERVFEFWKFVADGQGEKWLHQENPDSRFWGRPGKKNVHFSGDSAAKMFREADRACKFRSEILDEQLRGKIKGIAPKSPFQIGGAGAVGTGSLRGIPRLHEIRTAGFSVWPFDVPKLPLLLEIYPRLLTGEVNKSGEHERQKYLALKRANDERYKQLTKDVLKKAEGSEDAFDALVSVMEMASRRQSFTRLKQATDETTLLEGSVWGAGSEL